MTRRGRRAPAALPLLGLTLLGGCMRPVDIAGGVPACTVDDGGAANGVVLMAQSVPTASWVPCLDTVPLGWHFSGMEAGNDAARFWLDSDRDGVHAIQVELTERCDVAGATEIPSDRDGMRRLERVTRISPTYVGERYYLFDGGCITVLFTLSGENRGEPLAVASEGVGVVSRADLRAQVREETDGRLELDPRDTAEGRR